MKAGDFFSSIYELVAKVLPGLILVLGLTYCFFDHQCLEEYKLGDDIKMIILFIVSYITGHILSAVGAPLDYLADPVIKAWWGKRKRSIHYDYTAEAVSRVKDVLGIKEENVIVSSRLMDALMRARHGHAIPEIDNFIATARFFRSLVVVFFVFAILSLVNIRTTHPVCNADKFGWWPFSIIVIIVAGFFIFTYYRYRRLDAINRYFLSFFLKDDIGK